MQLEFLPLLKEYIQFDWTTLVDHWFSSNFEDKFAEKLIVIFPAKNIDETTFQTRKPWWGDLYLAWYQINVSSPNAQLNAWRVIYQYGDEIAPNLGVFRARDSFKSYLFWLTSQSDYTEMQARLTDLLPKISAYWHIRQGRGLFHAAGILHKDKAYLFVGVSGAGKSTVSFLSLTQGDTVIHDDHVVVYSKKERWLVSDVAHSVEATTVNGILFLIQDQEDQLIPITTAKAVKNLITSLQEHGKHILIGDVFRAALSICSEIARSVPFYELHFRKSPDFWKLIDEQFSD